MSLTTHILNIEEIYTDIKIKEINLKLYNFKYI